MVKPRLYPGPQADGSSILAADFVTTITVRLQSLTLTLQVELVEDKRLADARVRFVLPNRAAESRYVAESIAKAKVALEAEYAARVEAAGAEQLLRCAASSSRTSAGPCRRGSAARTSSSSCGSCVASAGASSCASRWRTEGARSSSSARWRGGVADGDNVVSSDVRWLTNLPELSFRGVAEGVASFEVEDGARAFTLRVAERGGRSRSVALDGFGF